jgi:uncharacterized protein
MIAGKPVGSCRARGRQLHNVVTTNTLDRIRRHAVARTLFPPTTLTRAIERLGFVQADPIRAPARAQDLTLRHRVRHYRNGDLERRYAALPIEEDFFINYGFLPRAHHALMHPRPTRGVWDRATRRRADDLLAYVRAHGTVHPRQVEAHFAHGRVTNYWGGVSSATTHLLDALHYRGLLRIAARSRGIRLYALPTREAAGVIDRATERARLDALVDLVVHAYAPVPQRSLAPLVARLRYAAPQWTGALRAALARATHRLQQVEADTGRWYLPAGERIDGDVDDRVRLLAPFDPIVWDRRRFEMLWGWAYRFEAYTPVARRKLGYYALPLLYRDRVIGWANATNGPDGFTCRTGFAVSRPRDKAFTRALDDEIERLRQFVTDAGTGRGEEDR